MSELGPLRVWIILFAAVTISSTAFLKLAQLLPFLGGAALIIVFMISVTILFIYLWTSIKKKYENNILNYNSGLGSKTFLLSLITLYVYLIMGSFYSAILYLAPSKLCNSYLFEYIIILVLAVSLVLALFASIWRDEES